MDEFSADEVVLYALPVVGIRQTLPRILQWGLRYNLRYTLDRTA